MQRKINGLRCAINAKPKGSYINSHRLIKINTEQNELQFTQFIRRLGEQAGMIMLHRSIVHVFMSLRCTEAGWPPYDSLPGITVISTMKAFKWLTMQAVRLIEVVMDGACIESGRAGSSQEPSLHHKQSKMRTYTI